MRIGYACLALGVPNTELRGCILKNASEEVLLNIISHNLNALENIIDYNIKNNVSLFRISSDLVPFGSSPVNSILWWEVYAPKLTAIGQKIEAYGIRVSMYPG